MVYGRYIYPAGLKDIRGLRLITVKRSFFISHVQLCDLMDCRTPASLSFTISRCLLKLMSVELVMPSNHLIPCCPFSSCLLSFPASGSFLASQLFTSGGQSIGASASASVFPMNIQDWLPLGLIGLISWQSKGLSRVFSNTTVQKHHLLVLSFFYDPALTSMHEYRKNHSFD